MDWLHRHLLAAAASISPTRRSPAKRRGRSGGSAGKGKRARSMPMTTVDIDPTLILLSRTSSSSTSLLDAAPSIAASCTVSARGRAPNQSRSALPSNGLVPPPAAKKRHSAVSFALMKDNSSAEEEEEEEGSQLYIEDRDEGLLQLGGGGNRQFRKTEMDENIPSLGHDIPPSWNHASHPQQRIPALNGSANHHHSRFLRQHCVVNPAFQDSSPLPVRRHPQLIAWPPVPFSSPPASSSVAPPPLAGLPHSPAFHPVAVSASPASSALSPRRRRLLPSLPLLSLHSAARHLLFPSNRREQQSPAPPQQSPARIAEASEGGRSSEYRRVPEEGEEEEEEEERKRKKHKKSIASGQASNTQRQHRAQRRQQVHPQHPRRAHHHPQHPSTSASAPSIVRRPTSSACPLQTFESMARPAKLDVVLHLPEPCPEEQLRHAWNPEDRSMNLYVKEEDRLTLHRHPVAQSTDCIRGKIGYTRGFHVWQLTWPSNQRGTHAVVGVVTKDAPLHAPGYSALIGADAEGYGWNIVDNKCHHDAANTKSWSYPAASEPFDVPDQLFCILDMDEGQLAFATESRFLGVAFRGLRGKKLYPAISVVWGHAEITLKYRGGLDPEPRQLMDICRRAIRTSLGKSRMDRVDELNLPPSLRHYLMYK